MNHDVAEVNGSDPRMLPDSFLHKKEPGYVISRPIHVHTYIHVYIYTYIQETV